MADFYLSRVIDLITPGSAPVPYCMNEFATCNANEEVIFNNLLSRHKTKSNALLVV